MGLLIVRPGGTMARHFMRMKIVQHLACSLVLVGLFACNQQSQNAVEPTVTPEVKLVEPVVKPALPRPPVKPVKPVKPSAPVKPVAPAAPAEPAPGQAGITAAPELPVVAEPVKLKPLGKRVSHVPMKGMYVALTFDDGPHPSLTNKALEILNRHGAKGTFFVLGQNVARYKSVVSAAAAGGHEIGVHTWSHIKMNSSSRAKVDSEISRTQNLIGSVTGVAPRVMRPPYGATNKTLVDHMFNRYGMASILWDVDTVDWRKPGVSKVINTAVTKAKPGSIILVHDIHASTIDALEGIVTGLQARGFKLVTVSELLAIGKREAETAAAPETPAVPEPAAPAATPEPVAPAEPAPAEPAPEAVQPEPAAPVVVPDDVDSHASSDDETPLDLESLDLNEL